MPNQTTTYIDPNGEKKIGYIYDQHTYSDPEGKNPVGIGSVVDTDSGKYIMTEKGGQLYSDYLKNNGITEVETELNGAKNTGFAQNGATYTDPMLQNRVGTGTVVTGADGTKYIKTDTGSQLYADYLKNQKPSGNQPEGMDTLQRQMDELDKAYAAAVGANDSIYAAQLQQQKAQLQAQIDELNRSYADLNKQLYRDYMFNQRDLPQSLAAQGITGGMAESSRIGLTTNYEGNLAANERERLSGITDLERGGNDADLQLRIAKAQADADAADNRYTRLAAVLAAQQAQDNFNREMAADEEERTYTRQINAAKIAADLGDNSKLYEITGAQPAAPTPVYQPVYNPAQRQQPTYTPTRDLSGFIKATDVILNEKGGSAADKYLESRVTGGFLTPEESKYIEDKVASAYGL